MKGNFGTYRKEILEAKKGTKKPERSYHNLRKILRFTIKIIITAIVLAIAVGIYNFTKPSSAPIKKIKIVASYNHVDPKLIQNTIAPFLGNGFFYINVIRLQRELKAIPWVHQATIIREWPNVLIIKIDEQTPLANWGHVALINNEGQLFTPPSATFPDNLPLFLGPDDELSTMIDGFQKMSAILAPLHFTIKEMTYDHQKIWHLTLHNNKEIYLQNESDFAHLKRMVKLYPKIAARHNKEIQTIDLRYQNGIAVR